MYMLYRYECVGVLKHILDWLVALGGSRIDRYVYIYMVAGRNVFSQKCAKFVDRWGPAT